MSNTTCNCGTPATHDHKVKAYFRKEDDILSPNPANPSFKNMAYVPRFYCDICRPKSLDKEEYVIVDFDPDLLYWFNDEHMSNSI